MNLKGLAEEYDEEEDPLRRSLVARALVNKILEGPVNDETSEIGMGPVNLNIAMARDHGWSKEQIERAWSVLEAVSMSEGEIAKLRSHVSGEDREAEVLDAACSKCGKRFEYSTHEPLVPGIQMLLDAVCVHVGFLLLEDGSRIVCVACGAETGGCAR